MLPRRTNKRCSDGEHGGAPAQDALSREGEQVTLDSLQVGERAILLAINGDRSLRRRMMEMGLLEGSGCASRSPPLRRSPRNQG